MASLGDDIGRGLGRLLANPSLEALLRWLSSDEVRGLVDVAEFGARPYTRRILHRDERVEVALLGWEPGQGSPIHDHGRSVGAMRVLSGELVERRFRRGEVGAIPLSKRRRRPGALVREAAGTVHEVRNESGQRAVTLHAYLPAISCARTYAVEKRAPRLRWYAAAAAMLGIGLAVRRELLST